MKLIALIADIVQSRKIKDRDKFQQDLEQQLRLINKESEHLLSPYTLTLGDEFQAVYGKAGHLFRDIWKIRMVVHPQKVRFALGIGTLSTPINRKRAIGMDGPAFHHARAAIAELKKSSYLIKIEGEGIPFQPLVNNSLYLVSQYSMGWSLNRIQVLSKLQQGWSPKRIADDLGISTVAVYKNIKAGSLDVIIDLQKEVSNLLNEVLG